jgi:hypothetical protein
VECVSTTRPRRSVHWALFLSLRYKPSAATSEAYQRHGAGWSSVFPRSSEGRMLAIFRFRVAGGTGHGWDTANLHDASRG